MKHPKQYQLFEGYNDEHVPYEDGQDLEYVTRAVWKILDGARTWWGTRHLIGFYLDDMRKMMGPHYTALHAVYQVYYEGNPDRNLKPEVKDKMWAENKDRIQEAADKVNPDDVFAP